MNHPLLNSLYRVLVALLLINSCISSQWVTQISGTNYPILTIHFLTQSTGFIASNSNNLPQLIGGEIIRTTNGGLTWQRVLLDSNFRAKDFHFFDTNTGIAVGGSYVSRGYVFRTTNSGLNWIDITQPMPPAHLLNIDFVNNTTGFAGSSSGVFKTTDSGNNWEHILNTPSTFPHWGKVYFINANTGIFCRDSATVYKTINSGNNWQQLTVGPFDSYRDIEFVNDNTGFICSDSSRIYKTTNQGSTWSVINSGTGFPIYSLNFKTANIGYAAGLFSVIKTVDGGNSWVQIHNTPNIGVYSVHFTDVNTGYAAGDSGRVYKTTTGGVIGINPISTEIPNDFSLSQNYPNPFNPTTNIKFALPKAAFVKLAVYDMLGREVESLVNQQLTAGTYLVDWNAVKFSSGIYLYKLTTNDFNMVKKMSLIK